MSRSRTRIPADIVADVLFASDNTCCVCRDRGKAIQVHHLDEDPSNHVFENLAVLCLECHNQTQTSGGFVRGLTLEVVVRYRDEWNERVQQRRDQADRLAVARLVRDKPVAVSTLPGATAPREAARAAPDPLDYINSLPERRLELRATAQPEWDTGVTARMVQASYDYIDALQGILVTLASYYPDGHFGSKDPQQFFAEQISARFAWHRSYAEPHGPGTGGTIVNVTCSGNVIADVEKMVEDMARSLAGYDDRFDWRGWPQRWRANAM